MDVILISEHRCWSYVVSLPSLILGVIKKGCLWLCFWFSNYLEHPPCTHFLARYPGNTKSMFSWTLQTNKGGRECTITLQRVGARWERQQRGRVCVWEENEWKRRNPKATRGRNSRPGRLSRILRKIDGWLPLLGCADFDLIGLLSKSRFEDYREYT